MKLQRQNTTYTGTCAYPPELRYTPQGKALMTTLFQVTGTTQAIRIEFYGDKAEEFIEHYPDGLSPTLQVIGSERTRKYDSRDGEAMQYDYISVTSIKYVTE